MSVVLTQQGGKKKWLSPGTWVVIWPEDRTCERSWLLENVVGAVGVLATFPDTVDKELLDAAGSQLRVVSTMSVGYEHVDIAELAKRGIRLGYTPDVLTDAVADLTVMLALMAGRNVGQTLQLVKDGKWPSTAWSPFNFCGPQLSTILPPSNATTPSSSSSSSLRQTRVVGFLGFGRIAQATLKRMIPFGITSCIYVGNPDSTSPPTTSPPLNSTSGQVTPHRVTLETLARTSDILFILAPATPTTHHIISSAFLRQMKPMSVLVNTSRGSLVDSAALAEALREGWIWGAGLDVVEGEPDVSPIVSPEASDASKAAGELLREQRCVVLPHIGSATVETREEMARLTVANLIAGMRREEMEKEMVLS